MLTPENESSNLHLTHRENRKSDASSILKILPVKGVLFSALAELQPGKVRVSVCPCVRLSALFPGNRVKDFAETWSEVRGG